MEENKNLNLSPVQNPSPEPTSSAIPPVPETPKPKFRLPILLVGLVIFLLLIGSASAAFIFLPKSSPNQQKQTEVTISPQPTVLQTTIIPSPTSTITVQSPTPTPNPISNWKTFSSKTFTVSYKYPSGWENDNFCQACSPQPEMESSDERYLHPIGVKYPIGIIYNTNHKANASPLSFFINSLKTLKLRDKTTKELSVDGSVGLEVVGIDESGKKIALAVFENDGYIFQFSSGEEYISIFETLLSTIKFKSTN